MRTVLFFLLGSRYLLPQAQASREQAGSLPPQG